jgi:ABC-type thiamin/hydroxymethylpyrimidine transport system permease subunit
MQIPFIILDTLSEIVLTNMESNLLGITFAVLTLFEELMETEIDPILLEPSANEIKHPF